MNRRGRSRSKQNQETIGLSYWNRGESVYDALGPGKKRSFRWSWERTNLPNLGLVVTIAARKTGNGGSVPVREEVVTEPGGDVVVGGSRILANTERGGNGGSRERWREQGDRG